MERTEYEKRKESKQAKKAKDIEKGVGEKGKGERGDTFHILDNISSHQRNIEKYQNWPSFYRINM